MRILMVAPQPFFSPRGTPFSILGRLRALSALGHQVELLTYPLGEDVVLPGLTIRRCWRPPGIRRIPIGPSVTKLWLDLFLLFEAWTAGLEGRYDLVHTHEEAAGVGTLLKLYQGLPHLYDMHSSLPQQFGNFAWTKSSWIQAIVAAWERWVVRRADAVIAICPALVDQVRAIDAAAPVVLIENRPIEEALPAPPAGTLERLRAELRLPPDRKVVLYTGTIEAYQGVDLLLDALAVAARERDDFVAVVVGGRPEQVEDGRQAAERAGIAGRLIWTGSRPPETMSTFLALADILVSPRSRGTNTPLKLYSYMLSGRPILATRTRSHTQVLDDACALLVEPEPAAMAEGLARLLNQPQLRERLGAAARQRLHSHYSYKRYLDATAHALQLTGAQRLSAPLPSREPQQ